NAWGRVGEALTDAQGLATIRWVPARQAGAEYLSARLATGDSVVFTSRVKPGRPHEIQECCEGQSYETVGAALRVPPHVAVLDSFFNRVPGQTVRFILESGGGRISGTVQVTDSAGMAVLGGWTLGPTAPLNTVSARVDGGPSVLITKLG